VRRLALALLALALLAGCSATRFAYHNADLFLRWQTGRYLDVHGVQSEALETHIASFLAWHRAAALPEYAKFARQAEERLARGLSRTDLVWGYDAFQTKIRAAMRAAAAESAPLLDQLSAEQIEHLRQRFDEDNRKFAREQLEGDDRERRKRRFKRNVERLEDWLGELSDAQVERVRLYSERAPLVGAMRDRERRRLQAEFVALLRAREAARRLPDWAQHWDRGREPAFAAAHRANLEELFAMLLDLERMLTPAQRTAARARFLQFAADFEQLAKKP
jgi:hypothetical protein